LTYIYGVGKSRATEILGKAGISNDAKIRDLNEDELNKIRAILDGEGEIEGDLRKRVQMDIKRLMDIGCYPIFIARWMFGAEPTDVVAMTDRDPELRVDRLTSAMLRFPKGYATFTCAGQLVHYQRMQIHGTSGRIEVQIPFNAPNDRACRIFVDDGRELGDRSAEAIDFPVVDQYTLQGDNFSAAVRGARDVPVSVEDAVANMAVIDALFRSADSGRWERPAR